MKKSQTLPVAPLFAFDPKMDAKVLIGLINAAADRRIADIAARAGKNVFRKYGEGGQLIASAKNDLVYAKHLFKMIDKVTDRRARMAAYSALSHTICGVFAIAQSGIYPEDETKRSFDLRAAAMRVQRASRTARRDEIVRSIADEAGCRRSRCSRR